MDPGSATIDRMAIEHIKTFMGVSTNTIATEYVFEIADHLLNVDKTLSPSYRVIRALQKADPRVRTHRFSKSVLGAIFMDGVYNDFVDHAYADRLVVRARQLWGRKRAEQVFVNRCEILETWKNRDGKIVPDAHLIDAERRTIVCYEVEDAHPLNRDSLSAYARAWWTLDYVYWNLHLIAYDICGNARLIRFPETSFALEAMYRAARESAPDTFCES